MCSPNNFSAGIPPFALFVQYQMPTTNDETNDRILNPLGTKSAWKGSVKFDDCVHLLTLAALFRRVIMLMHRMRAIEAIHVLRGVLGVLGVQNVRLCHCSLPPGVNLPIGSPLRIVLHTCDCCSNATNVMLCCPRTIASHWL